MIPPDMRQSMLSMPAAPLKAGPNKLALLAGGVLALGVIALLLVLMLPKQGSVVVAVSGPGNKAIDSVQVFLDGKKQCDTSPCVASSIKAGPHIVKVSAPGYAAGTQAVKVVAGDEAVLNIQLSAASEGTGVKVTAEGSGLRLWIDDKEVGPLPQEVKDLTPGEHKLRVAGNDRFAPYEENVTVLADQIKSIGPLELKVVRGLAMVEPGDNADGAKVLLVNSSEKRQIPKLPYRVEISTDKGYELVASKKGYATTTIPVTFEPGKDQKRFVIDLRHESGASAAEESSPAPAAPAAPRGGSAPRKGATPAPAPAPAAPKAPAAVAASGQGTLNINSIPQSNVLLDGRPLGKTPRAGVAAAAGPHTVVFIHPEHGRKQVSVSVVAGKTATAAVRFP
jgi:serine/threonine-protein kinase